MMLQLDALGAIIRLAGDLIDSTRFSDVTEKSELDYVTDVDLRLDAFLTEQLGLLTPGIPVFSEERAMQRPTGAFWIIDPVDGTHNMMAGVPHYAVCAAFFDSDETQMAAVLDVVGRDLYLAKKGKGATLNGSPLRLTSKPSTLGAISSGALDALNGRSDIYASLRATAKIRNLGSQSLHLCYVADGRLGFAISQEARFWDDAAARLIAEEAGASYHSFAASGNGDFLDLAFSKAPLRSLCAHPDIFEKLNRLMTPLWWADFERA
ncbi:inositol monophosphatase family protein [Neorhizobium petrolearium]|uniref:inositol monophosphatase family protein n=1 Tax=Neorhizobium petrolearium TaxID=515361 RepID=UPI003F7F6CC9